ncbi:MAG: S8 family serine peptidase [Actinobacteria bacterium]|nr:S8 family serine peptidase [Actinomycetota bacterium]
MHRRHPFRPLVGFVFAGLVGALAFASAGVAKDPPAAVGGGAGIQASYYTPHSLSNEPVNVMVQLAGETVAEVMAKEGKITAGQKQDIKAALSAPQNAIKPAIQTLGGQVLADYQVAYNGIKVRINPNLIDRLRTLPGVIGVHLVPNHERSNAISVPYLGVPTVWSPPNFIRGLNRRIAIIDTGIDYTHGNYRAPGTVATPAEFAAADAADTLPANPALFGPNAPKVKGGIDLVGDDYNASGSGADLIPQPDPNPLDCNGHGSHVSGTAAGFGVLANGATFGGPYDTTTHTPNRFRVGPGVAPRADLYAVRVFGCAGSTNETVDAIEWSVDNGMEVINMSLGSPFGQSDDPSAVAADNAAQAGIVVVASAGNNGPSQYITGSPATGNRVISVAASESVQSFPGFTLTLPTAPSPITAINANGEPDVADGTQYTIVSINDNPATPAVNESLGCNLSDYPAPPNATSMAVTIRGVCARVARAIYGQQAGYAAVAMVNNSTSLPPYEGPIFSNPDTGEPFTVSIPFIGVRGLATTPTSDGARLRAASGSVTTVNNTTVGNPNFSGLASFTSGGPRTEDSFLKPNITAPGVSIFSTLVGSGNLPGGNSGTSMAAPHVAGVAALARQAHPTWSGNELAAAIVNTGLPALVSGTTPYRTSRAGTGRVNPFGVVRTQAVAFAGQQIPVANFGFYESESNYSEIRTIRVWNKGSSPVTFDVVVTNSSGSPHTLTPSASSVTVAPGTFSPVDITLSVPMSTAGNASAFREVAGLVRFAPQAGGNNNTTLKVPYYLVPRPSSLVDVTVADSTPDAPSYTTTATVTNNAGAAIAGTADFYAWGLRDGEDADGSPADVRAVGVQSFDIGSGNRLIGFGVSTWNRWSNASTTEFDISVDVDPQNGNGDDYVVVAVDIGAVTAGSFNGVLGSFVFSTRSGGASGFTAGAPTDGSTAFLPTLSTQFCRTGEPCLSAANPRFTYHAIGFDLNEEEEDDVPLTARFNPWTPAIFTDNEFDFLTVAPGASATTDVTINRTEWNSTAARGLMVIVHDNKSGEAEAELIDVRPGS